MNDTLASQLAAALRPLLAPRQDQPLAIEHLVPLAGGASRETWGFDAVVAGGCHHLVLRRDPPGRPSLPGQMAREAAALRRCGEEGLEVPAVLVDTDDAQLWGSAGMVMTRVEGETLARRILRDDAYADARFSLTSQCARFLAGLHRIDPTTIGGLDEPDPLGGLRTRRDELGATTPTFELALRWLSDHRPETTGITTVHGDFRLGNLIVGSEGLRAVLDWELVHAGDPLEDLGWLCVKAWRFGQPLAVAGVGTRDQLLDAYREAGGQAFDPAALRWWEVLNTLKWGLGCMGQASAHLNGAVRSVELAAIGRRACEQEWDLWLLLDPERAERQRALVKDVSSVASSPGLHGRPTAAELLEAVREFLVEEQEEKGSPRAFHARVAANAVAIVERELAAGDPAPWRGDELARIGRASEDELASAIRGGLDLADPQLRDTLIRGVVHKVEVANPRYLLAPPG
ncbi:MAG: hypothetical protein NVS3B21_13890 [Acidimicrobiales bacterium]